MRGISVCCRDICSTIATPGEGQVPFLDHINFMAMPGELTAIMGPSGCGKTTLMNVLSDRQSKAMTVSGEIIYGGHGDLMGRINDFSAYVMQEDSFLPRLTVRETIVFAARLRLSHLLYAAQVEAAEHVIRELGLRACANVLVGGTEIKGVSGGQRKRVSIAVALLDEPRILYLDEPTSGLDAALAFDVVSTLRTIASKEGRTIVATIHQPRAEVFAMFDRLLLMRLGKVVYHGPCQSAVDYFDSLGYPCPSDTAASDFYLDLLTAASANKNTPPLSAIDEGADNQNQNQNQNQNGKGEDPRGSILANGLQPENANATAAPASAVADPRHADELAEDESAIRAGLLFDAEENREKARGPAMNTHEGTFYSMGSCTNINVTDEALSPKRRLDASGSVIGGASPHHQPSLQLYSTIRKTASQLLGAGGSSSVKPGAMNLAKPEDTGEPQSNRAGDMPLRIQVSTDVADTFAQKFRESTLASDTLARIEHEVTNAEDRASIAEAKRRKTGNQFSYSVWILTMRSARDSSRRLQFVISNFVQVLFIGLIVGTVWYKMAKPVVSPDSCDTTVARNAMGGMIQIIANTAFGAFDSAVMTIGRRALSNREASAGLYARPAACIANFLADGLFHYSAAMLFAIVIYWVMDMRHSTKAFVIWLLFVWINKFLFWGSSAAVGSFSSNMGAALGLLPLTNVLVFLVSGYQITDKLTPKGLVWLKMISPIRYAWQGVCRSQIDPEMTGYLERCFGFTTPRHWYVDWWIMVAIAFVCRVLAILGCTFAYRNQGVQA